MVIVCGNCETRFQLEDSLLPAEGARVRCSRCQHRFHVKPPPASLSPDEIASRAVEDTPQAPGSLSDSEPAEEASPVPAPRADREEEDPDLENPEFLFDEPRPQRQPRETTAPPQARASAAPLSLEEDEPDSAASGWLVGPEEEGESPESPESTQPPASPAAQRSGVPGIEEAFELSSSGLGAPGVPAPPEPTGVQIGEELRTEPSLPESPSLGSPIPETPVFESDFRGSLSPESDSPPAESARDATPELGSADSLGDDWDDPDEDDTSGDLVSEAADEDVEPAYDWNALPAPSLAAAPAPRAEREAAERDATGGLLRSGAAVLGLVLLLATGVGLWNFGVGARSGPASIEGEGWRAESIEAFHLSTARGEPVLVIRGSLVHQGGGAWLPLVRAQLLAADGSAVGPAAWGEPVALEGEALSPSALSERLGLRPPHQKPLPRPAGRANGFTVLIRRPPQEADRYRLELVGPELG
jgi:predicted Zn finger-like uncharacterized protein